MPSSNSKKFKLSNKKTVSLWALTAIVLTTILTAAQPAEGQTPAVQAPSSLQQGWTKTWGGAGDDKVNRAASDATGNLYLAGEYTGSVDFDPSPTAADVHDSQGNSIDAFLSKYDAQGNFMWAKTWGGSKRDVAYGMSVDAGGNVYVVGAFMATVDFDPDPALAEIHASNAISGTIYHNNIYLCKFAPDGRFVWARTWGPSVVKNSAGGAEAYSVAVSGSYLYVVGDFSGGITDFNPWGGHDYHINHQPTTGPIFFDGFLSKFDLNGNFQWAKTWGGEGYDDGPGVAVDRAGSVYVSGMYASQSINFDPAGGSQGLGHPAHDSGVIVDVFLSKFDADGDFQWVRTWGGQGTEDAMGLAVVDRDDNVYVAGRFASLNCDFNPGGAPDLHSTNGGQDAFLSKFSPDGGFQWAKTWGGTGSDNVMGLVADATGSVFAAGWFSTSVDFDPGIGLDSHTSNGQRDAFISLFDNSGGHGWTATWGGSGNDASAIISSGGVLYASGDFAGSVDFDPGSGINSRDSNGMADAFVSQFERYPARVFLPLIKK